jgi:hypothetical protein
MNRYTVLPDKPISSAGQISKRFLDLSIRSFWEACRFVHELPYGYNSNKDDIMIIFKEKLGSCTTKHAVIATLAAELNLAVAKHIGIYAMTEMIVTGTKRILNQFALPYLPMVHCFLVYEDYSVDLTEGNHSGKNRPIDAFLYTEEVIPNISAKDEYLKYRKVLKEQILSRDEFNGLHMKQILHAREEGIILLKSKVKSF